MNLTFPLDRIRNREHVVAYSLDDRVHVVIDPRPRILAEDKPEMRAQVQVGAWNVLGNVETIGESGECVLPILLDVPENHHKAYAGSVDVIHNGEPNPMNVHVNVSPKTKHLSSYQKCPLSGTPATIDVTVSRPGQYVITIPYTEGEKEAVRMLTGQSQITERELVEYRWIMHSVVNMNRRRFSRQRYEELWEEAGTFHKFSSEMRVLIADSDLGVIVSTEVPSIESDRGKYWKEYRAHTDYVERITQLGGLHPFDYADENEGYLRALGSLGITINAVTRWGEIAQEVRRLLATGKGTKTTHDGDTIAVGPSPFGLDEYKFYYIQKVKRVIPCEGGINGYLCDVGTTLVTREIDGRMTIEQENPTDVYANARDGIVKPADGADKLLPMKRIPSLSLDTLIKEIKEFEAQQEARHCYGQGILSHDLLYQSCIKSLGLELGFFGRDIKIPNG